MTNEEYTRIFKPRAEYLGEYFDDEEGVRVDNFKCTRCGSEYVYMPQGVLPNYCPFCGDSLKRSVRADVEAYKNRVLAFAYNGADQECMGCEKRKNGTDETCHKCLHGKLVDSVRVIQMLLEELDKYKGVIP